MHITELCAWPQDDDEMSLSLALAVQSMNDDPCGEGFHAHKNGMIHVSIDLTDEERKRFEDFSK